MSDSNEIEVHVSIQQQRVCLIEYGKEIWAAPVSTSKYGVGEAPGSNFTPTGRFRIEEKIGDGQPEGMTFKSRIPTGQVWTPDKPADGRDWILTRILWLSGEEEHNANTRNRYIYFHGTNEEDKIGAPASHGCIRLKNKDVLELFDRVAIGTKVWIVE